jgi:predicted RNA-binding protein YlxR (DUF448 family)
VRVIARDGRVAVDAAARLPGRGAWLHPDPGCVEQAIRRRAFGRALRATDLGTADLLTDITQLRPHAKAERTMDNS